MLLGLKDSAHQEDFIIRLQHQEDELKSKSVGLEELRMKVKEMKAQAQEHDALEAKLSSLMHIVQRLPMVKAQVESLQSKAQEVEDLEAEERRVLRADLDAKLTSTSSDGRRRDITDLEEKGCVRGRRDTADLDSKMSSSDGTRRNTTENPGYLNALFFSPSFSRSSSRGGASSVMVSASTALRREGMTSYNNLSSRSLVLHDKEEEVKSVNLVVQVVQPPPPLSLQINIIEPPPPLLPPGVTAQMLRRRQEFEAMEAAHKEMLSLEALKDQLKRQVDVMSASPLSMEVQRLRQELLAMQSLDVKDLEREIDEMASASSRLEDLKARHVKLEAEADEAFILASQLPELEEAASKVVVLRRRKEELEVQKAEGYRLEAELVAMAAINERIDLSKIKLEEMDSKKAQLESMEQRLAERSIVESKLARAEKSLAELHHWHRQITRIQHEILDIRDNITGTFRQDKAGNTDPMDPESKEIEEAEARAIEQVREMLERERSRRNALLSQQKELERLARESEALIVDNSTLKSQCASAIALFSTAPTASSDSSSSSSAAANHAETRQGQAEAAAGPISVVFSRVRELEAEKIQLKNQVSELTSEIEKLRQGLGVSVKRLEEYRNLAATVSSMRKNRTGQQ